MNTPPPSPSIISQTSLSVFHLLSATAVAFGHTKLLYNLFTSRNLACAAAFLLRCIIILWRTTSRRCLFFLPFISRCRYDDISADMPTVMQEQHAFFLCVCVCVCCCALPPQCLFLGFVRLLNLGHVCIDAAFVVLYIISSVIQVRALYK